MDHSREALIAPGIPLTQIDPINPRRLLAFVNYWLSTTVNFLNEFCENCDNRFHRIERRLEQIETALTLVEAKLASVPNLQTVSAQAPIQSVASQSIQQPQSEENQKKNTDIAQTAEVAEKTKSPDDMKEESAGLQIDPELAKYFKMLQMGIPAMAIKQKMQMEGYDPKLLDNASAAAQQPAPAAASNKPPPPAEDDDSEFSGSEASSFSD